MDKVEKRQKRKKNRKFKIDGRNFGQLVYNSMKNKIKKVK